MEAWRLARSAPSHAASKINHHPRIGWRIKVLSPTAGKGRLSVSLWGDNMSKEDSSSSNVAWLSLAVSIIGLLGTNIWAYWQNDNQAKQIDAQDETLTAQQQALDAQKEALEVQKAQLEQTVRQVEEAHGILQMEASIAIWDIDTQEWTSSIEEGNVYHGETLGQEAFADDVYIRLEVTNIGTATTQVQSSGYLLSDTGPVVSGEKRCTFSGVEDFEPCRSPIEVPARSVVSIYVDLSDVDLGCNDYVEERGIVGAIRTIDDTLLEQETGTRVSFSDDCPN